MKVKSAFYLELSICCWVAFCFLSLSTLASLSQAKEHTEQPIAKLDFATKALNLSRFLEYTPALPHEITPDDLKKRTSINWQPIETTHVNLGFQNTPYWFKGTIHTSHLEKHEWLLEQSYPLIDKLDVFVYQQDKLLYSWSTGDVKRFSERPLQHANFLFPIRFKDQSQYTLYIRAENTEAMELPLTLFEYNEFTAKDNQRSVIDGIFYGFLIIMAAYNLVLYLNIRDKSYLYYVCYVISILLFFMSQKGLLYQYFFPQNPVVHHYSIPVILVMTVASVAMFFKDFLRLTTGTPRIWLVVKIILIANLLFGLLIFIIPYQISIFLIIGNAAIAATIALGISIYLSSKGMRTAQMILSGWTLLIICIVFMTLSKMGILYNEFMAAYGLRLGTSFEILIFSFALSYRINEEKQAKEVALQQANKERSERIRAQELALQHEKEASQAKEEALLQQKLLNESLEQLVKERTAKLEETLHDLEQANKELETLSAKDGLTGLFNRRAFDTRSQEIWMQARREQWSVSLLMIDIDYFKKINDSKGHQCGDYVLKQLANLMQRHISRPADLIARFGGEEFAVLLPNTHLSGAKNVAEKLIKESRRLELDWDGNPFHITISIGIHTMVPSAPEGLDQLIAYADSALYRAKDSGRNQYCCAD